MQSLKNRLKSPDNTRSSAHPGAKWRRTCLFRASSLRPFLFAALILAGSAQLGGLWNLGVSTAWAAVATDVASAGYEDKIIDVNLDLGWKMKSQQSTITREFSDPNTNEFKNIGELDYGRTTHILDARLAIGLWRGLELHFDVPFAVADKQTWSYGAFDGQSAEAKSTIANNRRNSEGTTLSGDPQPLFTVPGTINRLSLLDPSVGFSWAILSDKRIRRLDSSIYPYRVRAASLVFSFDYTAPLAPVNTPSKAHTSKPGDEEKGLGEGLHKFRFSLAMSKRLGIFEPFLRFRYTLPLVGSEAYDNCMGVSKSDEEGNFYFTTQMHRVCNKKAAVDYWNDRTGIDPPHRGGILLGTEIVPVEQKDGLRLAIGLEAEAEYISRARTYSELSDALGRLTMVEQHFGFDGRLFLDFRFSRFAHLMAGFAMGSKTPHAITGEWFGQDLFGSTGPDSKRDGVVSPGTEEVNPNYDHRWDAPGHFFRVSKVLRWEVFATMALTF